jgi:hypothetical protein
VHLACPVGDPDDLPDACLAVDRDWDGGLEPAAVVVAISHSRIGIADGDAAGHAERALALRLA